MGLVSDLIHVRSVSRFGVCCTITGGCGGSTVLNNSYFSSSSDDSSPCTYTVCKAETNICQIRLDFDYFVVEQPNTDSALNALPVGRTQCQAVSPLFSL